MGEAYSNLAAVYDVLMQDVDYAAWAEYINNMLCQNARPVKTVVDCACGTGELALRLYEAGYSVTGVDVSPEMLYIAQLKAQAQGKRFPLVCQDMRKLALHKPVDAICCACDGVNYLTSRADVQMFFQAAYEALEPGGLLLFDVSSRYKLETVLADNVFGEVLETCAYIWRNSCNKPLHLVEMELTVFTKCGALYGRFDEYHVQRAHSESELKQALRACGFTEISAFRAFTFEPAGALSERIQFQAKR